MFIEVGMVVRS